MGAYSRKKGFQKKSDSFTSRYISGDSRTFKDAPTTDSGAPIPTVSIPYGEESGGLISSIKKLLGKGNSDTEWTSGPANSDSNSGEFVNPFFDEDEEHEATAPAITPVKTEEQKIADGHKHARELSDAVISSKRKFGLITIKDGMFADVKADIAELNRLLDKPYPTDDPRKRTKQLYGIIAQYDKAIQTMQGYISHINEKGGGQSSSGKARLELVQQLLDQSVKDRTYFSACADEVDRNTSITISTWDEVLNHARVVDMTAKGTQTETIGAGASILTKMTTENGKTTFLKPGEKTLSNKDNNTTEFLEFYNRASSYAHETIEDLLKLLTDTPIIGPKGPLSAQEALVEFSKMTVLGKGLPRKGFASSQTDTYEQFMAKKRSSYREGLENAIHNDPQFAVIYRYFLSSDENIDKLIEFEDAVTKKRNETSTARDNPEINYGSIISDRNVSTSIMADRLGMTDIVARSQTVLMKSASGEIVSANSMEEAKGERGSDIEAQIKELEEADAKKRAKEANPGPPLKISLIYTPDVLIKMCDLMVFDIICGQTDRHNGNYMLSVTKQPRGEDGQAIWIVTDVKAFDNDLSFGNLRYNTLLNEGQVGFMQSLKKEAAVGKDADGSTVFGYVNTISCMSKKTYDRIMNYSASMALIDQRHLRSEREIRAMQDRLRGVKDDLRSMVESGQIMLVDENDDTQKQEAYEKTKREMRFPRIGHYFGKANLQ